MSSDWTSLHIFQHAGEGATDALLQQGIHPAVKRLVAGGKAQSWFFIRYWEGGPHVRLRLKGCEPTDVESVRDAIRSYFAAVPASESSIEPAEYYRGYDARAANPAEKYGWHADREIREIAYVPELQRYGGRDGIGISEELFGDSSDVAMAILRLVPAHSERLVAAVDLLLAMLAGMGLDALESIAWLRQNIFMWPHFAQVSQRQVADMCQVAEKDYLAQDDTWRGRLAKVQASVDGTEAKPTIYSYWAHCVRKAFVRYQAVEKRLTMPPAEVMRSQLHMLHNRLGISIAEECYVGWLTSLILARANPRGLFALDGMDAIDRRYHEQSKVSAHRPAEERPVDFEDLPDPVVPFFQHRSPISLPEELPEAPSIDSLAEVIRARRTHYAGFGGRIEQRELAALLGLSAGYVRTKQVTQAEQTFDYPLHTYPCAGARPAFHIYVAVRDVEGVEPGLYCYNTRTHELLPLGRGPDDEALLGCSPFLSDDDPLVRAGGAPLWLFPVVDLNYKRARYGVRTYRFVAMECGHLTQNLCLVATALKLSLITIGGFHDDKLNSHLGVDGVNRTTLYMIPIGKKTK